MARECEICGRTLKTGRKYCWEHRRTAQANEVQGITILKKADKAYIDYRCDGINATALFSFFGFLFFGFVWIFITLARNDEVLFLKSGFYLFLGFFAIFGIFKFLRDMQKEKAKREISEKTNTYINFVKEYVAETKKEKEFKKSLIDG